MKKKHRKSYGLKQKNQYEIILFFFILQTNSIETNIVENLKI